MSPDNYSGDQGMKRAQKMNVESVFLFLFFMGKESRSEAKGSGV
jgi:hypothetical protein